MANLYLPVLLQSLPAPPRSICKNIELALFAYYYYFESISNTTQSRNILIGNATAQLSKPPGAQILHWVSTIPNNGILRFRSFGNMDRLVVTNPEALKSVMSDHSYDYEKPAPLRKFLVKILGEGLIIAEGDLHKFQKKHLLPAFQVQHIRELYPVFWGKSRGLVENICTELAEKGRASVNAPPLITALQ